MKPCDSEFKTRRWLEIQRKISYTEETDCEIVLVTFKYFERHLIGSDSFQVTGSDEQRNAFYLLFLKLGKSQSGAGFSVYCAGFSIGFLDDSLRFSKVCLQDLIVYTCGNPTRIPNEPVRIYERIYFL